MPTLLFTVLLLSASGPAPKVVRSPDPVAMLGAGVKAARAGEHAQAIAALRSALAGKLRNRDYALFYLGEALAGAGHIDAALKQFALVAKDKSSRFATPAQWRAADVLWNAKRQGAAVAAYRKLLGSKTPGGDKATAWFRVGDHAAAQGAQTEATQAFETVMVEFAAHPLAEAAEAKLGKLDPTPSAQKPGTSADALSPARRIERAQRLSDKRRWHEAIAELERLNDLPPPLQAQRNFVLGQANYRSRKDYPAASALLSRAAVGLSGKQAAWAAFHAARALSRADRDDEAIVGYLQFVREHPNSEFAAEAQLLAGWLEFNRGNFAASVPALTDATKKFPKSPFAANADWYLSLGHYFLSDFPKALAHLADFEMRTKNGGKARIWPRDRVMYWRARILERMQRGAEARTLYAQLISEEPLRWYGLLAAQRLRAQKLPDPFALPEGRAPLVPLDAKAKRDPSLLRVDELLQAGLPHDAGLETEAAADALLKRLGREQGLAAVIDRSHAAGVYAKAYRLGEVLGSVALSAKPQGDVRRVWQAVYPQAYAQWVEKYGPPAGNPEHYLYTIMHKESGFDPHVVSYADARGLLQMIPPTSRQVAKSLNLTFDDDDLLDPEINIQLGASYIGSLYKKFSQQISIAAGSYNAGPGAMMRWLDRHGGHPLDEFVELVAYEQTREYIKRVTSIYARYRYLYAQERYLPELQVKAKYSAQGPDY